MRMSRQVKWKGAANFLAIALAASVLPMAPAGADWEIDPETNLFQGAANYWGANFVFLGGSSELGGSDPADPYQYAVEVSYLAPEFTYSGQVAQALFRIINWGLEPSRITNIYWDDDWVVGVLKPNDFPSGRLDYQYNYNAGNASDHNYEDPRYSSPSAPPNLTEIEGINPAFVATFGEDPDPVQGGGGGIHPPDWAYFSFDLVYDSDPLAAYNSLTNALDNAYYRMGIRVQGFTNYGDASASYITQPWGAVPLDGPLDGPQPLVPVPAAAGIGFLGLAVLGLVSRRKHS